MGRAIRGELYHCETGQSNDLLVFTADAQPTTSEGEYELSEVVLRAAKRRGATASSRWRRTSPVGSRAEQRVFGAATSQELLSELTENGVRAMKEGGISGMNGIIIAMAGLLGWTAPACLGRPPVTLSTPSHRRWSWRRSRGF